MSIKFGAGGYRQVPARDELAQFFGRHDDARGSGFITRLDRTAVSLKRAAFFQALLLNMGIFIVLAAFTTFTVLQNLHAPHPQSVQLALALTQNLVAVSACIILLRSTLLPFFMGECRLRLQNGFRDSEIVIRRLPRTVLDSKTTQGAPSEVALQSLCLKAARSVDPSLFYSKASSFLSRDFWALEYSVVMDAYRSIAQGTFVEEDLDFAVWKCIDGTWHVYELWQMHELMSHQQEYSTFEKLAKQ